MVDGSVGSVARNMRSPGWACRTGTWPPAWYCCHDTRGSVTPAAPNALSIRPEQSYELGPVAPQIYGFPTSCRAKAIAAAATPLASTAGPQAALGLTDPASCPASCAASPSHFAYAWGNADR